MNYHSQLSSLLPINNQDRFNTGTPAELWSSITRCWEISPSSERIVEDIEGFRGVLEKIVESKGCVVSDENFRTGRRARRANGDGLCKRNPQIARRVANIDNVPLHPSLEDVQARVEVKAWQDYQRVNIFEYDSDQDSAESGDQ